MSSTQPTYKRVSESGAAGLFAGPGELRALSRAIDWAATPLGPVDEWPPALRTAVRLMMASPVPTSLWVGESYTLLYNDAYRPILGVKHPAALGRSGFQVWNELWPALERQFAGVRTGGASVFADEALLTMQRLPGGREEDAWFTYALSALEDEHGNPIAVYNVAVEITEKVRAREVAASATEQLRATAATLAERSAEAEAARRMAERERARVQGVLEGMSDAHAILDADFHFIAVNKSAERLTGKSRGEMLGRSHWDVFPASVDFDAGRAYRRVVAEGVEAHIAQHYVGEGYDVHLEIDAYPTEEGGVALFWRDVSERVRNEEAIRESEERYRALFNSLDDGFCVIDILFDEAGEPEDYRFVEVNPAFARQTGLDDAVGRRIREILPHGDPRWLRTFARVALSGEAVRVLDRSDAVDRWYDVYAFRVEPAEQRRVAVLFNDVSVSYVAARERERLLAALELERARLEEVFRSAPSFIVAFRGPEQVYEFVNEAYYQLVGHRDILGKPLVEALPEIREQGFKEVLDRVLETGEPWVGRESPVLLQRVPGAPAETRYLDMVFQALTESDGTRSGVVAHGSDVTAQVLARRDVERLLSESELARAEAEAARAEAEAANRAKSEFLAVMSHELRTPLNAIGGYTELLEMGIRGPVTSAQLQDLRRIQTSQRHLLGLINEVLNYARIETGSVHFEVTEVSVRDALAAAELLVAPQARARGIALTVRDPSESLTTLADAEKLRQILVNLASNAVKFTEGGGRIEIYGASVGADVAITVADTGIGIPPDKLDAIFDPFVQVRADLTRPHEGTGLGLAISRDLARGMRGDITARSELGVGSTFTLTLPAVDGASGTGCRAEEGRDPASGPES